MQLPDAMNSDLEEAHPDKHGGSEARAKTLNAAIAEARKNLT